MALFLLFEETTRNKAFDYGAVMEQDPDILDNISTGVLALDGNLRVTSLNAAGEALLETSASRCLGKSALRAGLNARF